MRRCAQETYVSAWMDEDRKMQFTAECNGGPAGLCGWEVDLTGGLWCGGITDEDFKVLHLQHVDYSRAQEVPTG